MIKNQFQKSYLRNIWENNKLTIVIYAFFGSGLIIALIWIVYNLIFSCRLEILVAPESANIIINNKPYKNGKYNIRSGDYDVKITKDGFIDHESKFTAKRNSNVLLLVILEENSTDGTYYKDHPEDASLSQLIGDRLHTINGEKLFEKYPITKIIPKTIAKYTENYGEYIEYRLDYKIPNLDKDNKLTVIITESDYSCNNKNDALQYIKDSGYNPDDYIIQYKCEPKNQAHP